MDLSRAVQSLRQVAESTPASAKGFRSNESLAKDISDAQNMLGELSEMGLHEGIAGQPDLVQALDWYRKALKNGHDRAMYNIAAIYEKGEVVPRDMDKAIRLYREAEKKGNPEAIARLEELRDLEIRA